MIKTAVRATLATVVLLILTGALYPIAITAVAQLGLGAKADGSLVSSGGKVVGSSLLGQQWQGEDWFYGRPSAIDDDASTSSGSNLGPNSADLAALIRDRADVILALEGPYAPGLTVDAIPADLLTASASGLDPDISRAAAMLQVARVASVRGLPEADVRALVEDHVQGRALGFLGELRVNVLELNLALDTLRRS